MKNFVQLTVLLVMVAVSQVASSSEPVFRHEVIDADGPVNPWAKITGDLNGDGYEDAIVGGRVGPLVWYEWPSWKKHVIADGGYATVDGETGDIDGDGDLDVIMGGIVWYENPGSSADSASGRWKSHRVADHPTHDVEVGDLDLDGDLDIVTRDQSEFRHDAGNEIHVWIQTGTDSWTEQVITCPHGEGIKLTDLDRDGDLDIVTGGIWYENTDRSLSDGWPVHTFATFHKNAAVQTVDFNGDGRIDVVLAPSELRGQYYHISWFEAPSDPKSGGWTEHAVTGEIECVVHALEVADVDCDGTSDIIAAEMHQGDDPDKVSVYLNNNEGRSWTEQVISTKGSHLIRIADFGNDGDIDIIGANHGGSFQQVEYWENRINETFLPLDRWTHIEVDSTRGKWGDWNEPKYMKYFGLSMVDITGDNYKDIVSGRYFYRNPGGAMTGAWKRSDFGFNVDGMLIVDVDGDKFGDIIAEALPDVYWIEAVNKECDSWRSTKIAEIPATGHINGQGYKLAQIVPGGKPEILLSSGEGIFLIQIPNNPEEDNWRSTQIAPQATEEGIGVGDIDGDGDIDIAAGSGEKKGDGMNVSWWENPGEVNGAWVRYKVGETIRFADRFEVADFNGDGLADIAVSEERWPEPEDAHVFWFEQLPGQARKSWKRHTIATQNTSNNLDIGDMDGDGDIDIITAEHRGTKQVKILENDKDATEWIEHIVSAGKEGHLGARVADMDGDGDLDILNIAWDDYKFLHLWRNDSIKVSQENRSGFYREYWAERDEKVSNHKGRLRVNDPAVSLDPRWGIRNESLTNGLMLIDAPENLFLLDSAELYCELWGGHPGTANKRFILNGKSEHGIQGYGTEKKHCTYYYPTIQLPVGHLVKGINAFQFTCDKGTSFWGHFIIDNAALRCFMKQDHPDITGAGLDGFNAEPFVADRDNLISDKAHIGLKYPKRLEGIIQSVDYYGRYSGFDDDGDGLDDDWHGFTFKREPVNHIGVSSIPPFAVDWDTSMIPGQDEDMAVMAVVNLKDGLKYRTAVLDGLNFPDSRPEVKMYYCESSPVPFWSRASRANNAVIRLPDTINKLDKAVLMTKVWDGGEGDVSDPFTLNGNPYTIISGTANHNVVYTKVAVDIGHLKGGVNAVRLLSDTDHHGIEMLKPGPCLVLRYR
ncbi:FG-GAP repeat domain-containing protein [Candidatus Latescibacterota bacterium]